MSEKNISQNRNNPYDKKLTEWEKEIIKIENSLHKLSDVNIFTIVPCLVLQYLLPQPIYANNIYEKREQLEKIRSGVKKMTETLYQVMSDDSSNAELDNYSGRIVNLRLKTNELINQLSKKDAVKYLRSIVSDD